MTPPGGEPQRRAGDTLTILQKKPDGRWRLARDAKSCDRGDVTLAIRAVLEGMEKKSWREKGSSMWTGGSSASRLELPTCVMEPPAPAGGSSKHAPHAILGLHVAVRRRSFYTALRPTSTPAPGSIRPARSAATLHRDAAAGRTGLGRGVPAPFFLGDPSAPPISASSWWTRLDLPARAATIMRSSWPGEPGRSTDAGVLDVNAQVIAQARGLGGVYRSVNQDGTKVRDMPDERLPMKQRSAGRKRAQAQGSSTDFSAMPRRQFQTACDGQKPAVGGGPTFWRKVAGECDDLAPEGRSQPLTGG